MPTARVKEIERRRARAQISVEDLAKAAESNSVTYWRWLTDKAAPTSYLLNRFERALNHLIGERIHLLATLLETDHEEHHQAPSRAEERT